MSVKIVLLLLGAGALVGKTVGFVFRWLLILAHKGSIEIEVKQLLLNAREKAEKIVADAKTVWADKEFAEALDKALKGQVPEPWPRH